MVDQTIALQAKAPGLNNLSDMVDLGNRMWQNRTMQSNQAAGQAFQQSIGPDGQLDQPGLNQRLAADPNAALAAPGMSQQGLQNLSSQLQAKGISLQQAMQKMGWTGNALGTLLTQQAQGTPITRGAVINTITDGVKNGIMNPQEGANLLTTAPTDPKDLTAWVQAHYATAQAGVSALTPHIDMQNLGNQIVPTNTNALAGTPGAPAGTPLSPGLSPSAAASPVTFGGSAGQPVTTTLGNINQNGNQLPTGQGGSAPVVAGLTPAEQAAQSGSGSASIAQGTDLVKQASGLAPQRSTLQNILANSASANPGPIAGSLAKLGGFLEQIGLPGWNQATAYQLTQKSTMGYVATATQALGVPTDSKLMATEMSVPNAAMTHAAIQGATGLLLGAVDYRQAQAQAWTRWQAQNGPASFPQFQADWNSHMNTASVFQLQYLPKDQQKTYANSLNPAQKAQFMDSRKWAISQGLLNAQ